MPKQPRKRSPLEVQDHAEKYFRSMEPAIKRIHLQLQQARLPDDVKAEVMIFYACAVIGLAGGARMCADMAAAGSNPATEPNDSDIKLWTSAVLEDVRSVLKVQGQV